MTSANDIFAKAAFNEGEVTVEAWADAPIRIRELSAKQANDVIKLVGNDDLRSNALAVAYGCITEDGKRLFANKDVDKILDKLRVQDITNVAQAIMDLSRLEAEEK